MQLGASESFPSCGLSPTVNTQDGGDAAFPLLGVSASASGREQESRGRGSRGEAVGVGSGQPCPGEGLGGGCGKFYHSPERLLPAECAALQKGNINMIIIILFI